MEKEVLKLSQLGSPFIYSYGDEYNVSASFIYRKIKETPDISLLEPVGLIVNEHEVNERHSEIFKLLTENIEFVDGKPSLSLDDSNDLTINYQIEPVLVDITVDDLVDAYGCECCHTTFKRQDTCPVCGNSGSEDELPLFQTIALKNDVYFPQEHNQYIIDEDVKEIRKTHPHYDPNSDYVLWLMFDLYERYENLNVFGYVNILKKDGSSIPVETVVRHPYPNKSYYQISEKVKVGKSWKRGLGIPVLFNSLSEIQEIERIVIKWEIHTDSEGSLLVETLIANQPLTVFNYCDDDRKRMVSVKIRDSFIDTLTSSKSVKDTKIYMDSFSRDCMFQQSLKFDQLTNRTSQNLIYDKVHEYINDVIYKDIIISSDELMSIQPEILAISKALETVCANDTINWRISFGVRHLYASLNYHREYSY